MTSTSPKADPQEAEVNSSNVPTADPCNMEVGDELRPSTDIRLIGELIHYPLSMGTPIKPPHSNQEPS